MTEKYIWKDDNIPVIDVHSIKKHDVLREYLKQYIMIVGGFPIQRKQLKITFIDGFSGGGVYENPAGGLHYGSPLIFLKATEEAAFQLSQDKPFELDANYFFLEKKKKNLAFLGSFLEQEGYKDRINKTIFLKAGLFNQNINFLINQIYSRKGSARRCLFFLDQYGYSDIPLSSIMKIFANLPNAEVILTFYVDYLIDYMANTDECKKNLDKTGLSFNLDSLDEIKQQKEWRFFIQKELYKEVFRKSGARYLTNFFIKSNDSHKSYWLLHLSMHPTARNEMQKLHWSLKNYFCHEGKPGLWMLGYDPKSDGYGQTQDFLFTEMDEKLNHKRLLEEIPAAIPKDGASFYNFVSAQCNSTPSTAEMIKKAIMELYVIDGVRVFTPQGNLKRKGAIINKDDIIKQEPQSTIFHFMK